LKKKVSAAAATNANASTCPEAGERKEVQLFGHSHGDGHGHDLHADADQLLRYRVVAQVSYLFKMKAKNYCNFDF